MAPTSTTSGTPVRFVAHFHEHGVEDTNYQGVVVHAMPGDLTAWGGNEDTALKNFDAMLVALTKTLKPEALTKWLAEMERELQEGLQRFANRTKKPRRDGQSVVVRAAGGLTYLLVRETPERVCEPCET